MSYEQEEEEDDQKEQKQKLYSFQIQLQNELDRAKRVLLYHSKPQHNMYNMNHQPNTLLLNQRVQFESQMFQNYNKYIPPYQQTQYDSQQRDFNQSSQFYVQPSPQPYHCNLQPPQQNRYQPLTQQNYYESSEYDLQKQFSGIAPPNSFYSPYYNYSQQNQPFQQQSIAQTQPLSETELEYIEFQKYKEYNLKQQQQIDDQDFQDFQEFRKVKQEQLLRQRVEQVEEKRKLTHLYKWKNRQVYSEKEYKCQLDKKRDIEQCYTKLILQDPNLDNTLIRPQTSSNIEFLK